MHILHYFRVAVVGNVDAGKSTLLGVLTHGELDNGRGFARQKLFRHKHEMETGRTSSVGNDILGFDSSGKVVNKPEHGNLDWVKICEQASKVNKCCICKTPASVDNAQVVQVFLVPLIHTCSVSKIHIIVLNFIT